MSDERFDQDLRSVMRDDAPREVPDQLRRRVAGVPMTHPVASRSSRPMWGLPVLVRTGALAAAAIVLAVAFLQLMPRPAPSVGGDSSRSPSVAPSPTSVAPSPTSVAPSPTSVAPSATSSAPTGPVACRVADINAVILGWQGAAGSRIADVEITNTSKSPCDVPGNPGLQLLDGTGRVLIDSATAGPSGQPSAGPTVAALQLAPGGHLRTEVRVSNYCGAAPTLPISITFMLSDGGRFEAKPGPGVASDMGVPPCMGSTGSLIEMNGWRK